MSDLSMIGKEKNFTQKQFLDITDIRSLEMLVFFRYLIVDNIYLILIIIIRLLYVKMPCKFKHSYTVATVQSKRLPRSMVIDLEPEKRTLLVKYIFEHRFVIFS